MQDSLDNYRMCEVGDCRWQVTWPETRCHKHGGPQDNPEYLEVDETIVEVHGFPGPSGDCE